MTSISHSDRLVKLPVVELNRSLTEFFQPVTALFIDQRLDSVTHLLTQGNVMSQSNVWCTFPAIEKIRARQV